MKNLKDQPLYAVKGRHCWRTLLGSGARPLPGLDPWSGGVFSRGEQSIWLTIIITRASPLAGLRATRKPRLVEAFRLPRIAQDSGCVEQFSG